MRNSKLRFADSPIQAVKFSSSHPRPYRRTALLAASLDLGGQFPKLLRYVGRILPAPNFDHAVRLFPELEPDLIRDSIGLRDADPLQFHNVRTCHLLAILALTAINAASAAESWAVTGRVVGVSDGDTITVLDDPKSQHKIRIAGIDASEKGQAFGERSRQSLAQVAHGKDARIECHKTDRFGRRVCKVWFQPLDARAAARRSTWASR